MKILVIGDSCKDVFIYGKANRLCPEAPVPVFIPKRKTETGGMAANVYENIESLSLTNTITSPYFFCLLRPNYLNICLTNLNLKSISLKGKQHYNQIDSVMITSSFGDSQFYKNGNPFYYIISENSISSINVMICDEIHNHVDFNNIDFFMTLNISFQYKKEMKPAENLLDLYNANNLAIYDFIEQELEEEKEEKKNHDKK